ncbi:MAG: atpF [Candidatus Magasanikbacteria bacterium]|nr:atpF [Candidatus Magasanikbacteria bacterium]
MEPEVVKESFVQLLGINWKLFLAQLVNFVIVLLVLWRWVFKPLVKHMDERSKKIEKSLDDAKLIEERMKNSVAERENILKEARHEAQKVIAEGKETADKRREEMMSKAKDEVTNVIAAAKLQIAHDQVSARVELRQETASLVAALTEKILGEKIDAKKDRELLEAAMVDVQGVTLKGATSKL